MQCLRLTKHAVIVLALAACATAPKTKADRDALVERADATLQTMLAREPGLRNVLDGASGYAVFPSIGKGGVIAGGAYGRGVIYENGRMTGFVELNQGSLGAQIGAQTFAELVVLDDRAAVARLKSGEFSIGGNVSGVLLTTGAAATASFQDGVAVFVMPLGGAMVEVSVSGQTINFEPDRG